MKRLFFILIALASFSSCLDDADMFSSFVLEATFQYDEVDFRADSTYFNINDARGFGYNVLNFTHKLDESKSHFLGGFLISSAEMPKSGNTENLNNTYRAYLSDNVLPGNIYTVYYQNSDASLMPEHDIEFPYHANGTCAMNRCYLTNTVQVADYVRQNFKVGDKLSVKAVGYLSGVKTGEAEMALAEFTAQKDSIVSKWTAFDLSKLGSVDCVDFEVISSDPAVPAYFCMDSVVASITIYY